MEQLRGFYVKFYIVAFLAGFASTEDSWPLYRIATILHDPWVMKNGTGYKGFMIDLLDEVSIMCRFHYKLQPTPDAGYQGAVKYTHGQYESVVSDVEKSVADIGAADLMITEDRMKRVAFTGPIISTGAQILVKKPLRPNSRSFVTVLSPFTLAVWLLCLACIVLVTVVFYAMERFTLRTDTEGSKRFTLLDSFVFTVRPVSLKGHKKTPESISGRLLVLFWRTFCFLIVFTYLANLTSLLLHTGSGKPLLPFKTFSQLAGQSDVTYGGWLGMALNHNDNAQLIMDRFISSRFSYYTDINEAVSRVRKVDQRFAAILSGTEGEYLANKYCDVMLLREQLFPIQYAMICRRGLEGERLCGDISMSLLRLVESGMIQMLNRKWWGSDAGCPVTREDEFNTGQEVARHMFDPVTPVKLGIPFVVLLCGLCVSVIAFLIDVCRRGKVKGTPKREHNPPIEAGKPMLTIEIEPSAEDGGMDSSVTKMD